MVTETQSTEPAPDASLGRLQSLRGQNLLVSGPPLAGKGAFVVEQLAEADEALLVTTTRDAARQLSGSGAECSVVDCTPGETGHSGVTNVGNPGDLTGISMPVSQFLDESGELALAFDSISSLLMYADEAPVFRFLSVLTGQIRQSNGVGLFTLDEGCHEPEIVNTLGQLFDGRIELSEDGTEARTVGIESLPETWFSA